MRKYHKEFRPHATNVNLEKNLGKRLGRRLKEAATPNFESILLFLGFCALVMFCVLIKFQSDKGWSDVVTNFIADLVAVIINTLIVSRLLKIDHVRRNRGKIRACADDIREFFVCANNIVCALIADGAHTLELNAPPPLERIREKQAQVQKKAVGDIPLPAATDYIAQAAFLINAASLKNFTGHRRDGTHDPIDSRAYAEQEAAKLDRLYRNAVASDYGFIEDSVIRAMMAVRDNGLLYIFKDRLDNLDFHRQWPSYYLKELCDKMTTIVEYYAPITASAPSHYEDFIKSGISRGYGGINQERMIMNMLVQARSGREDKA